ncbi:hypothetical protein [Arthrobacter sp. A5]|uniref:hypothetical protein n=1 Tax=Arthrobacter sp. A5 TaxID=576926 RepID=UPI003DA8185A
MPDRQPVEVQEGTPVCALPARGRVRCSGFVDSVTILPPGRAPEFSAIITDVDKYLLPVPGGAVRPGVTANGKQNHRIRVIWLGRRRVPGIAPGTRLRFEGMVALRDGLPTMFNPRYEIIGKQEI